MKPKKSLGNRLRQGARPAYYRLVRHFSGPLGPQCGVILLYHSITKSSNPLSVDPADFRAQLEFLNSNFEVLPLGELASRCSEGQFCSRPLAAITFDDGFLDNLTEAAPILADLSLPATFFVTSGFVGGHSPAEWGDSLPMLSWEQVAQLRNLGHSIGGHTLTHPILLDIPVSQIEREVRQNKIELEQRLQQQVDYFAYPVGQYNQAAVDCVRASGFKGAVTTLRRPVDPKFPIFELPRVGIGKYIQYPHYCAFLSRAVYRDMIFWL